MIIDDALSDAISAAMLREGIAEVADLRELDADAHGITRLDGMEAATRLRHLRLDDNAIADLTPLAGLTDLTGLFVADNTITDVSPISQLTRLPALDLSGNNVADLTPPASMTCLTWLDVSRNPLRSPDIFAGRPERDGDSHGEPDENGAEPAGLKRVHSVFARDLLDRSDRRHHVDGG